MTLSILLTLCRFTTLVAPAAKKSTSLLKLDNALGNRPGSFAVARSGGSVPRFSKMAGSQVAPGFGVEASAGSYNAALLKGNISLLLAGQPLAGDIALPHVAGGGIKSGRLAGAAHGSQSMSQLAEQQHTKGPEAAKANLVWSVSNALGLNRSTTGRSMNIATSGYWVSDS